LTVTGADGKRLPISTYKGPLDDLVVVFLSARCPTDQEAWPALRRLYEDYKDWNVTFLGVSQDSPQSLQEVQQAAAKAGLPTGQAGAGFPIVRDESGKVTRALGVQATPEALILDEWSYLRYRGALDRGLDTPGRRPKARLVRRALNTLIGHSEAVKTPQPDDYIGCPIQ
jgi:peroxiredoxin